MGDGWGGRLSDVIVSNIESCSYNLCYLFTIISGTLNIIHPGSMAGEKARRM